MSIIIFNNGLNIFKKRISMSLTMNVLFRWISEKINKFESTNKMNFQYLSFTYTWAVFLMASVASESKLYRTSAAPKIHTALKFAKKSECTKYTS
jgi:hypothetical protein